MLITCIYRFAWQEWQQCPIYVTVTVHKMIYRVVYVIYYNMYTYICIYLICTYISYVVENQIFYVIRAAINFGSMWLLYKVVRKVKRVRGWQVSDSTSRYIHFVRSRSVSSRESFHIRESHARVSFRTSSTLTKIHLGWIFYESMNLYL